MESLSLALGSSVEQRGSKWGSFVILSSYLWVSISPLNNGSVPAYSLPDFNGGRLYPGEGLGVVLESGGAETFAFLELSLFAQVATRIAYWSRQVTPGGGGGGGDRLLNPQPF